MTSPLFDARPLAARVPVVGIDPGLEGAIAVIRPDGSSAWFDMPTVGGEGGEKRTRDYDAVAIRELLRTELGMRVGALIVLEELHASPLQRPGAPIAAGAVATSNFRLGGGMRLLRGIVELCQADGELWRLERVAPQRWRKPLLADVPRGESSAKSAAKALGVRKAAELFPAHAKALNVTHSGRADALLIAEYGRRFLA